MDYELGSDRRSMYLLRIEVGLYGPLQLCRLIADRTFQLPEMPTIALVSAYLQKYADLTLDFADATLVATAMEQRIQHIYTMDDDFRVVRVPIDGDGALEVITSVGISPEGDADNDTLSLKRSAVA